MKLAGKRILVTGASSGIGQHIAHTCAEEGASVILNGRDETRLTETLKAMKQSDHRLVCADLSAPEGCEKLASETGPVDGMVYAAGVSTHFPVRFIKKKQFDETFGINFQAAVLLTAQLLAKKCIQKNASLVYLSSIASGYPYFGGALYTSSKSALESYVQTLAVELASLPARANALAPSFVNTPMLDKVKGVLSEETLNVFRKQSLLGFGEPVQVSRPAVFLLSEEADWITGQTLKLGGL